MNEPKANLLVSKRNAFRLALALFLLVFLVLDGIGAFQALKDKVGEQALTFQMGPFSILWFNWLKILAALTLIFITIAAVREKGFVGSFLYPDTPRSRWIVALSFLALFALDGVDLLDPAIAFLKSEHLTFKLGAYSISVYFILKSFITLWIMLWLASVFASGIEKYLKSKDRLRPANRALVTKVVQIIIYILVFLLSLQVLGIDVAALTVFSGALGIGLGFGLQKIASNFISGLILLFEKSVEENDLVQMDDGTFGFVRKTSARYTLIESTDGKELMIPNEDFITRPVTNWTFSNTKARVEVPIGVAYDSDIVKARELILEAANEHPRCSKEQVPVCFLRQFGDSSVNFLLYFWVDDVENGRYGPQSDVMFAIWQKFREHHISIPFPQRDIHIKSDGRSL